MIQQDQKMRGYGHWIDFRRVVLLVHSRETNKSVL